MMNGAIREICALSILCGIAMSIMPEGGVKRVASVLCTAVLLTAVLSPLRNMDMDSYALMLTRYREQEAKLAADGEKIRNRLNRAVIESECETYIMDKAAEIGAALTAAKVEAQWSTDGVWVPYAAQLTPSLPPEQAAVLAEKIAADLGIPEERVAWGGNE